jgi:hypothetical protein
VTFVTALALAIALLVAIPYAAHRLRRQRADERPFPPAHLVPPAPPRARRRSALEDRALFSVRALAVIVLALLGASPFVRCSRLSLHRAQGASMALAIVVDDSMSMRAPYGKGGTRFERAKDAAKELLASSQEGDAIAIVLAGSSPRVLLAATTDLSAAKSAIDALEPSDRATDLDGALSLARSLIDKLPQVDRRVVVLSDLADGKSDGPALGEGFDLPLWVPLDDMKEAAPDCALVSADRDATRVHVHFACSHGGTTAGRNVVAFAKKKDELAHAAMPASATGDVTLTIPSDTPDDLEVRMTGSDAIPSDDVAPVLASSGPGAIGAVSDAEGETAATGGAPVLEQALAALKLDLTIRPIPAVPDRAEDLLGFIAVVVDDPPGFTPEQRHALDTFVGGGGTILLALGPRAASAPLGATLEPILGRATAWDDAKSKGADPGKSSGLLSEAAKSLVDLGAARRTTISREDVAAFETLVPWTDGAPLLAQRPIGRGLASITTLPFSLDLSDFALRPGFLAILDTWIAQARTRVASRRTDVGTTWAFAPGERVVVTGPSGPVSIARDDVGLRATPPVIGAYTVEQGGRKEFRVAQPPLRELDLRPRQAAKSATSTSVGGTQAPVDASPAVAVALLALVAAELALRLRTRVARASMSV